MTSRSWAVRIVLFAGGLILSLLIIAFLAVQIQQRTLRRHAERLSTDMHQIRLYQSSWADAQRLMHRWGEWGYYDGSCTAASCKYEITMGSIGYYNPRIPRHAWLDWLFTHDRFNLYDWLGGRSGAFYASFTVHDGTIWRADSAIAVSVPTLRMRRDNDWPWSLTMSAVSRQRLHRTIERWWDHMGSEDELAQHPYYKVGRPGGCIPNCQTGIVYYSTHTPPAEIVRLTSDNFSCFTRFNACAHVEDLLPAAREWHLYSEYDSSPTVPIPPPMPTSSLSVRKPIPLCDVPVWALARDARYVLAVEALPTTVNDQKFDPWMAKVRVVTSLKEPAPWLSGALVKAYPYANESIPPEEAEHLVPGRRFIVFPVENVLQHEIVTKDSPIKLERCGVQEDTPEIRRELEKGFAQNDTLHP